MREFELRELRSIKCPICGCRNKLHTELVDETTRELFGYTFKCCACGHVTEMLIDAKNNGIPHASYVQGRSMCIQPSFCPHTECIFHGYGWPDGTGYLPDEKDCDTKCSVCPHISDCPIRTPVRYEKSFYEGHICNDPIITISPTSQEKFL